MPRVLITGSNGLLGQKLVELLSRCMGYNLLLASKEPQSVFGEGLLTYVQVDTTQKAEVRGVIDEFEPEVIVNTAAITDVDRCETDRESAWRVNVTSVENLVQAAKLVGARLIHLSSDYVFDGKAGPYGELDRPGPINYYGKTKLASENVVRTSGIPSAIVRTIVLYGQGRDVRNNFVLWVLKNLDEKKQIRVVDDQISTPTFADDLAYGILKIIELGRTGLYHISGPDMVSRYEMAAAVAKVFSLDRKLLSPVKSIVLRQVAARPLRTGFITLKAETDLGIKMSPLEQGLIALKHQLEANARLHAEATS